jgi:PIN domain nuclease of toxin-antitoxin system
MSDETDCLSSHVRALLTDHDNELFLHQASVLEIQIKYDKGNLPLGIPPHKFIPESISKHKALYHALSDADIYFLERLPKHHRDPFDRLLICHAIINGLTIITPDPLIHQYPVNYIW